MIFLRSKLARGQYNSVEEIVSELRTMYANCMLYNETRSILYKEAKRHSEFLESLVSGLDR